VTGRVGLVTFEPSTRAGEGGSTSTGREWSFREIFTKGRSQSVAAIPCRAAKTGSAEVDGMMVVS
jgi:hypothetical protein